MRFIEVILVVIFAVVCFAAPFDKDWQTDPELTAGYVEGDMILGSNVERTGLRSETMRWPNNVVYYRWGEEIDEEHKNHIRRGYNMIEKASCVKIVEDTAKTQEHYVSITTSDSGCFSYVGYEKRVQQLNYQLYPIDTGCFRLSTIMHEMLHALGFYHTQSAHNRDDYVRIALENVEEGMEHNFNIYDADMVDDFDLTYDYGSVMHYGAYAFSKNGEKTIIALDESGDKIMGQRIGMSKLDILRLNAMYKCPIISK